MLINEIRNFVIIVFYLLEFLRYEKSSSFAQNHKKNNRIINIYKQKCKNDGGCRVNFMIFEKHEKKSKMWN